MICPHCTQIIKYKERSYLICSKCQREFAFEPKRHPLQLSDSQFTKIIAKLSENDKQYFTKEQLQFALSRKKMKSSVSVFWLIIPAGITSLIAFFVAGGISNSEFFGVLAAAFLAIAWLILMVALKIRRTNNISLPQTPEDFEISVINRWKEIYNQLPAKLIHKSFRNEIARGNLRGILLCETQDTANCLTANHADINLSLAILTNKPSIISSLPDNLPIFILHNASVNGCNFANQIKTQFGSQRRVVDIGFRPQTAIKSKLTMLRQKSSESIVGDNLTAEELIWLNDGYYTPLFTLRPEKLIQYVTKQIENRAKIVATENVEEKAKAIGFMTWIGEK